MFEGQRERSVCACVSEKEGLCLRDRERERGKSLLERKSIEKVIEKGFCNLLWLSGHEV